MLSANEATRVVKEYMPTGDIQKRIEYEGLYLFQIFTDRPGEEELDPFYSVNKETGEFRDFSIITDGNTEEILRLFSQPAKEVIT